MPAVQDRPAAQKAAIIPTSGLSDEGIEVPQLHILAEHNQVHQAQELLAEGKSQVDATDAIHSVTALMLACAHGHPAMVEFLLQAGAGVDLADADGATALMWAEALGSASCAALLRKAGADMAARDHSGLSVADYKTGPGERSGNPGKDTAASEPRNQTANVSISCHQATGAADQHVACDDGGRLDPQLQAVQEPVERLQPAVYRGAASMGSIRLPNGLETSGVLWADTSTPQSSATVRRASPAYLLLQLVC